jgi:hypothetical protein
MVFGQHEILPGLTVPRKSPVSIFKVYPGSFEFSGLMIPA